MIRLGNKASANIPFSHARLVDLPKLMDYYDFLDVEVAGRLDFAVMCEFGPEAIFRILGKLVRWADSAVTHYVWLSWDHLFFLKNYRDLEGSRRIGCREILDRWLPCVVATRDLKKYQMEILENTPDEFLAAGIEMVGRLTGPLRIACER